MLMRRNKKGQMGSQIVVFILALLIGGLVLVFGAYSINKMLNNAQQAREIQFEKDLIENIGGLTYGSTRGVRLTPPGKHRLMCFADLDYLRSPANAAPNPGTSAWPIHNDPEYAIVYDSIFSDAPYNVFLMPDGSTSFDVSPLEIPDGFLCLNITTGGVEVGFKGKGNRTLVFSP